MFFEVWLNKFAFYREENDESIPESSHFSVLIRKA